MPLISQKSRVSKLDDSNDESANNPTVTLEKASGDSEKFEPIQVLPGDNVETLTKKMEQFDECYKKLHFKHEKTIIDLEHERHRVKQLERQLQFVKDNQGIFDKLRETYINMKYNESAGRKLVEIRDKSVQTWGGMVCGSCLDTEQMRQQLEKIRSDYEECIVIRPTDLRQIEQAVQTVKNYINKTSDSTVLI